MAEIGSVEFDVILRMKDGTEFEVGTASLPVHTQAKSGKFSISVGKIIAPDFDAFRAAVDQRQPPEAI